MVVGCYYGYTASGGPVGVGTATAKSMVLNTSSCTSIGMLGTQIFWGSNPRARSEAEMTTAVLTPPLLPPRVEPDLAGARRSLRDQVARLEAELVALQCSSFPKPVRVALEHVPRGGPRLLSIGDLELMRDDLHRALGEARAELDGAARARRRPTSACASRCWPTRPRTAGSW